MVLHFNLCHQLNFVKDAADLHTFGHLAFLYHCLSAVVHFPCQRFSFGEIASGRLYYLSDDFLKRMNFVIKENDFRRFLKNGIKILLLLLFCKRIG